MKGFLSEIQRLTENSDEENSKDKENSTVTTSTTTTKSAEDEECVICFEGRKDHVVIPCGHVVFCSKCAQETYKACPTCQQPITQIMKIFLSW